MEVMIRLQLGMKRLRYIKFRTIFFYISFTRFQGDGSLSYLDNPNPFPFSNEVDDLRQLTSKSSSDDNNSEILGHQFLGTPLLSGGIPAFASAVLSSGIPRELLVAPRNVGFDAASTIAHQLSYKTLTIIDMTTVPPTEPNLIMPCYLFFSLLFSSFRDHEY